MAAQRSVLGGERREGGGWQGDNLSMWWRGWLAQVEAHNPTSHLQVVDMVRSELEAAGVKEEAQEKLLAGLQSAVRKCESEARQEEGRFPRPRLTAPGRNQMVSSKLTVEVAEGVAMRYVVATEDIKAGEVGGLSHVLSSNSANCRFWWKRCRFPLCLCQASATPTAPPASDQPLQVRCFRRIGRPD